nr:MAG TPA: hypothetical protein [Caudoviricetes sp.]
MIYSSSICFINLKDTCIVIFFYYPTNHIINIHTSI